tara:strand:- start:1391 stop:1960 length:570 start_codon:yes stop_codon:yes gene_type:complete
MSNSLDSQLNTIFDEKQKKLFKECKKNYGVTLKDIQPSGKRKNKPYTLKDIQKACSEKKKQTKKTKKNKKPLEIPATRDKPSASKYNSSKITVYLSNPSQKKEGASRNTSNNYKTMDIDEFKEWCMINLERDIQRMGFDFMYPIYTIINPTTLKLEFNAYDTYEDSLQAISFYQDEHIVKTVRFDITNN